MSSHQRRVRRPDNPARILFVSYTSEWKGPTNSLLLLLRHLKEHYDVSVLVPGDGPFPDHLRGEGIRVFSLPSLRRSSIPTMWRLLRRERIDLVYGNNTSGGCRNAWLAATLARRPFVGHVREMGRYGGWGSLGYLRLAAATIAVSEAAARGVQKYAGTLPYVVHNGVVVSEWIRDRDSARSHLLRTTGVPPDAPIIIGVGTLSPRKGQENAVRGLAQVVCDAQVPPVLLLVGDAQQHSEYAGP